ncbi:Protein of unknown function [Escherichia coli D6-117.29]|nr:Protein of unknown function [Escherichia coli D6-117.29]
MALILPRGACSLMPVVAAQLRGLTAC